MQAGYMSGEGNSSLSFVNNRLRALFGSEASPENKQKAMDARLHAQIMMQQQMQRFRQALEEMDRALMRKIAELDWQLENLRKVRDLVISGEYDASNQDHRDMADAARPLTGMSADEIVNTPTSVVLDRLDAGEEAGLSRLEELELERENIGTLINRIDQGLDTDDVSVFDSPEFARDEAGRFINPVLERAREASGLSASEMTTDDWDLIAEQLEAQRRGN
ncbi:MAG: hypothetical protein ACK4VI_04325 [Alphaproteobacteria bacterium]